MFKYRDRVRIKEGFYGGLEGYLIGQVNTYAYLVEISTVNGCISEKIEVEVHEEEIEKIN